MTFLISFISFILLISVILLDIGKKLPLLNKAFMSIYLIFAPHIVLIYYLINHHTNIGQTNIVCKWIISIEIFFFIFYVWLKANLFPSIKKQAASLRLRIMIGGERIVLFGLYTSLIQILLYIVYLVKMRDAAPIHIFVIDLILAIIAILILLTNGMIRILCTSKRLNIAKRFIVGFVCFIPIINIFAMLYACHTAKIEYDHDLYKVITNKERVDSHVCKTKYPLVLVHGVGFRDLKYINYWGRIPKELIRNGATIYYGNQEAWGTVEYNAQYMKNKILQIIKETGCEKVNIIAHSKGGLDSRYMVSKLEMGKYVASLTMMSSPHRGCKFVDIACKIPDKIYRAVSNFFDKYYKILGDKNPDFYTASRQFSTYSSSKFNEEVKDVPGVYYQSYATAVKNIFSDYVVSIPYVLSKLTSGENDGLVSIDSAKWGHFKGVIRNNRRRGISHGDIIDLRREDYKGFDVLEKYVEIVSDLKEKGF
ncbi:MULTISPECIES: lipase family alpha/beta hydrolase [Clostridium]|uniref:Hydrolase of alpha/beta superfamily, possible membrane associated lipase n=1 Tax=Clostridium acetobutylicum (strain ATCC 824 / DSM 792 / JCM 1419 / IAM 19013 / LMG 5710 / NBRC 13948 / NRRL B-527 / VKM B-1787 / 2291 / W) TaxID=272562 RepID=Q97K91_CLOAB|nr:MULTISPECIES: triacylglycerol lipase [Clostridium]AAK79004.1 Hydrolase of alpha/beta superfamily, possible membrane associated lipase [Clostridium acetobutylicum ATCC 824]ADZ20079.1 Hydrolase of alpha/beta superfamily, possible membrane associated lipase [Clostridium acetobutylicum EA 2018]AEI31563.1 alpha/beta fold family hydrolase membrane associated lipase [Clostridium acetobutylicum DSM 1731]AWV81740.1 triacylglycerol lipase [Clostridium acetobutylicum]MBC2395282.1 triacylglycerol lipas